jgi:hypothetical protein
MMVYACETRCPSTAIADFPGGVSTRTADTHVTDFRAIRIFFESARTGVTGALCSALMPTKYINRSFACSVLRLPVSIKLAIVCFYIDTQDANEEDQVAKPLVPPPLLP